MRLTRERERERERVESPSKKTSNHLQVFLFIGIFCVGFLFFANGASAATITASKSGNWSDTTVWTGGVLPGNSDTADTGAYNVTIDTDLTGTSAPAGLTTSNNSGYFSVAAARQIGDGTHNVAISYGGNSTNGFVRVTSGTLTLYGSVINTAFGHAVVTSGSSGLTINNGTNSAVTASTQSSTYAISWGSTGALNITGNITSAGSGTGASLYINAISSSAVINGNINYPSSNNGQLVIINASTTLTVNGNISNTGIGFGVRVNYGTLIINGQVSNTSSGYAVALYNGANLVISNGTNTAVDENTSSGYGVYSNATGTIAITGNIVGANGTGYCLYINATSSVLINGNVVYGSSSTNGLIRVTSAGSLTINGSVTNTSTGYAIKMTGSSNLIISNSTNIAIDANTSSGYGLDWESTGTYSITGNIVSSSGTATGIYQNIAPSSAVINGNVTMGTVGTNGLIRLLAGTLTINGQVSASNTGNAVTVNNSTVLTINGSTSKSGTGFAISARDSSSLIIAGGTVDGSAIYMFMSSSLTINNGSVTLSKSNNSYTGGTTLNGGILTFGANSTGASGSISQGPIGTSTLTINGGYVNSNGNYTINNAVVLGGTGTINGTSSLTLGGIINIGGNNLNVANATGTLTLSNTISGAGGITISGTGNLALGANYTAGSISVTDLTNNLKIFAGGGHTFGNFTVSGDNVVITGNNTFSVLAINNAGLANGLKFASGSTQTVLDLTTNGSAGNLAKLTASTTGSAATISKSGGRIAVDYMSIQDSIATGGAQWYAGANSNNVLGNSGWIFTDAPNTPVIANAEILSITTTTAVASSTITDIGLGNVTNRGFVYGTDPTFTTVIATTSDPGGWGTGSFSVNLSSLSCYTTYYVRAYAVNEAGTTTASAVSFTPACTPSVPSNVSASSTSPNQASISWTASSIGNYPILYYSIVSNPAAYIGTTTNTSIITTGLTNSTIYTFTISATNSIGTSATSSISNEVMPRATNVAVTYYVDSIAGSDLNSGTAEGHAWQTISKVNSLTFQSDDLILFKRGGTWNEQLIVPSSGTSGHPIVFGAYGTGENPVILGSDVVSGWTQYSGNIYVADFSGLASTTQLYVDGVFYDKAHYPNSGYRLATSNSGTTTTIIDSSLSLTAEQIIGSTVVARTEPWIISSDPATDYDSETHTITFALQDNVDRYKMRTNYGYYLQNKLWMLDMPGEWYYDSSAGKLYLWTPNSDNPSNHTVTISNRDYGIKMDNKQHITVQDMGVLNVSHSAVYLKGNYLQAVDSITLNDLSISGGRYGIFGCVVAGTGTGYGCNLTNLRVENSSITNTLSDGIRIQNQPGYVINGNISNNTVTNAGNMGVSPKSSIAGIFSRGDKTAISGNTVTNSGYIGVSSYGDEITISNNYINGSCLVLDDCGGIYTANITAYDTSGTISGNTIINSIGNWDGTAYTYTQAHGIYLDNEAPDLVISNNTIYNAKAYGIFINGGYNNTVSGNYVYGAGMYGIMTMETHTSGEVHDNVITSNLFETVATSSNAGTWLGLGPMSFYNKFGVPFSDFGTVDYNIYCHPYINYAVGTRTNVPGTTNYSLSAWQTLTGEDAHSTETSASCSLAGLQTPTVTNQTVSSVTLNSSILSSGFGSSTIRGFYYGLDTSYGSAASSTGVFGLGSYNQGVSGLSCGTTYHFTAFAKNSAGTGTTTDQTFTTSSCVSSSVPDAPTSVSAATSSPNQATISFTPGSDGGSAILYYLASSTPGNFTATSTGSPIIVTGLTNTTSYTFAVYAVNAVGTSTPSSASNAVTPTAAVVAPTVTTYITVDSITQTSATLNGNITGNGGSDATQHGFAWGTSSGLTTGTATTTGGGFSGTGAFTSSSARNISSLSCGTTYYYRAYATNAIGTGYGIIQNFNTSACNTVPGAPTGVSAVAGNGQATISFTAPSDTGGSTIIYYTASSSPSNIAGYGATSPITVIGLTNGTLYTFTVTATNAQGTSTASAPSSAVTPSLDTAPPGLSGGSPSGAQSAGTTQVTLSLTTDEAATCRYSTVANTPYASMTSDFTTAGNISHSTTITGLSNGSSYTYYVRCIDTSNNPNTSDYPISFSISSPASSGGGSYSSGGGSAYFAPVPVVATTTATTTTCKTLMYPIITKQLSLGMTGNDVVVLQKILALERFFTTSSTSGTYGPQTAAAVSSFQKKNNIVISGTPETTGLGNVGPKTRAFINQLISQGKYPTLGQCVTNVPVLNTPTTNVQSYKFTRSLTLGSTGADVKALQVFLNSQGFTVAKGGAGSPGNETTYFGNATKAALIKFQEYYAKDILMPNGLTKGTGFFGVATMNKVNAIMK